VTTISNIRTDDIHPQHQQPRVAPLPAPIPAGPTPTQQIVQDANRIEYVTDSLGRVLGVKRINAKHRFRVVKALSTATGEKPQALFLALIACACCSVDGDQVPFPINEIQVEALISRLEQEGLDAIGECIATKFPDASRQDIKNS
jgi:hypothetical protein